jgi:hypothetical protein
VIVVVVSTPAIIMMVMPVFASIVAPVMPPVPVSVMVVCRSQSRAADDQYCGYEQHFEAIHIINPY